MSRHPIAFTLGAAFAAALIGLTHAPVAGADTTDLDGFEDLHGTAPWTSAVDSLFVSLLGPTLTGEVDSVGVDTYNSVDADPFSDLVGAIDPSAFTDGVPNPNDLLGAIVPDLDYGLIVYDLPVYFQGTGLEPLINLLVSGFENSMVALDSSVDNLLGGLSVAAPAATLDMQASIFGIDLFPTAGNTATAISGMGDIAIAIGTGSDADASGGIFDSAFANGTSSDASATGGSFDSATAVGSNSTADAGTGLFDSATANGASSFAEALAGNFDTATATGNSDAFAFHGDGDLASAVDPGSAPDFAFAGGSSPTVLGSFDIASVLGTGSSADAGASLTPTPGDFDLAAVFGDMLHAIAGPGNFMVDILP